MKIVHICAGMERTNGAAVVAAAFAREQARLGHDVLFATTEAANEPNTLTVAQVTKSAFARTRLPILSRFCFSAPMFRSLKDLCRNADLIHVHCDWTFPVWWGAFVASRVRARLIFTPHGSFDPIRLRHGCLRKRLVASLDRRIVRTAEFVHATSAAEAEWIRAFEPHVRRIVLVPPGVDLPPPSHSPAPDDARPLRVLYLGRRHPLKGIDLLEEAVRDLPIDLRIESHAFGDDKETAFAWCDLLCLPTRSENFGLVVAEALAHGRPVVTTKAAPWAELVARRCGWWTDVSANALREAMLDALRLPRAELRAMGDRGRDWMAADYSWSVRTQALMSAVNEPNSVTAPTP